MFSAPLYVSIAPVTFPLPALVVQPRRTAPMTLTVLKRTPSSPLEVTNMPVGLRCKSSVAKLGPMNTPPLIEMTWFDVSDRKSTRLKSSPNAHLVCSLLLEKKKLNIYSYYSDTHQKSRI